MPGIRLTGHALFCTAALLVTDAGIGKLWRNNALPGNLDRPICNDPHSSADRQAADSTACAATAANIIKAYAIWQDAYKKRGLTTPPAIDAAYGLRVAGNESDMGRLQHKAGSPFSGLGQFSNTLRNALLISNLPKIMPILKAARDQLPALQKIKGKLTEATVLQPEIYADTLLQALFIFETGAITYRSIQHRPGFTQLGLPQQQALLYAGHIIPSMVGLLVKYQDCPWEIADYTPAEYPKKYFHGNSGVFQADGQATAAEVLSRTLALTDRYLQAYLPGYVQESRVLPQRRGQSGLILYVWNYRADHAACYAPTPAVRQIAVNRP